MTKYYRVSETELRELLESAYYYRALESGGVDNWEWMGDSVQDFIDNVNEQDNSSFENIEDIVEYDLNRCYHLCLCKDQPSSFNMLVEQTLI